MRRFALGLLLACRAASSADLMEVYNLALANDPTFEAARHTLEAARQKLPQARAGLLPTINLTGNDGKTRANATFTGIPEAARDIQAWTWTVQLTQPLIRLQNVFAYTESESLVLQAEAQFAQAEQDLIIKAAQAYFDVLVAEEAVTAADAQVKAMQEQWKQAKRGYEMGIAAITDAHEAKSKAELARSQHVAALNDLETKRSELERLVGEVPSRLAALRPLSTTVRPQPDDALAWAAQAKENNAAVRAQKAAFETADAEVSRNRAEHLPTLDWTASHGSNFSSGSLTTPSDYTSRVRSTQTGVQLTIPIFSGGASSARVAEAIANRDKARAQLEEARRKAGADARQAYAAVVNSLSQIEALSAAVESGASAVKGNRIGYKMGIRINSDVLSAEQQLYATERDLAKARYEALLQGLKLKAAAGILAESDLATINVQLAERSTTSAREERLARR